MESVQLCGQNSERIIPLLSVGHHNAQYVNGKGQFKLNLPDAPKVNLFSLMARSVSETTSPQI